MNTIAERAKNLADWILRRDGMLKHVGLQELIEKELKEQRDSDIEQSCDWMRENLWDYYNDCHDEFEEGSLEEAIAEYSKTMKGGNI